MKEEEKRELLENYTNWLYKWGYTDSDTWSGDEKAVDRYLEEFKNINKHE